MLRTFSPFGRLGGEGGGGVLVLYKIAADMILISPLRILQIGLAHESFCTAAKACKPPASLRLRRLVPKHGLQWQDTVVKDRFKVKT